MSYKDFAREEDDDDEDKRTMYVINSSKGAARDSTGSFDPHQGIRSCVYRFSGVGILMRKESVYKNKNLFFFKKSGLLVFFLQRQDLNKKMSQTLITRVRRAVTRALADGTVTALSPLSDVPYVGDYLVARLSRFPRPNAAAPAVTTVGDLWRATENMTTTVLIGHVQRALQNARGNQCVLSSPRQQRRRGEAHYHTADVNTAGYAAIITLLAAAPAPVRYRLQTQHHLPSARAAGSKRCGCHTSRSACTRDNACTLADDGVACVPRAENARGFDGVSPLPDQNANGSTARARASVGARARARRSPRNDPDSQADVAAGHGRSIAYARRRSRMWRRPGARMRLPQSS